MKNQRIDELNKKIIAENNDKEIVLGYGRVDSKVILIGEAPGANEVKLKKPFVGQAGKYLDEFLENIQLDREELYITNAVKFRPTRISPKTGKKVNRAPTRKEIELFKEYLYNEIEIIKPKIIVTLGNIPLKSVSGNNNIQIGNAHGEVLSVKIDNQEYKVFPLYHPAAVIYNRELRNTYLEDLKKLKNILEIT